MNPDAGQALLQHHLMFLHITMHHRYVLLLIRIFSFLNTKVYAAISVHCLSVVHQPEETHDYIMQQTMIRVADVQRSLDFYTKILGMTLLYHSDFPEWNFAVYFVGKISSFSFAWYTRIKRSLFCR